MKTNKKVVPKGYKKIWTWTITTKNGKKIRLSRPACIIVKK